MLIPCKVRWDVAGSWLVTFPASEKSLFLQSEEGRWQFARDCGKIEGQYDPKWLDLDPETIEKCPEEYFEIAEEV